MGNCYDIPQVIITIRGGVAEILRKDEKVTIEIRDYDVDGIIEDRLDMDEDENGDRFIRSTYE